MARLSDKYIAGFLDADGTFGVRFEKKETGYFPCFYLQFSQEAAKDKVLHLIQDEVGGNLCTVGKNGGHTRLDIPPKQGRMLLDRIRKHLVAKRDYAATCLQYHQDVAPPLTLKEMRSHRDWLKEMKDVWESPIPNFPPRKWLAGFFDGDGCLAVSYRKQTGCAYLSARVNCEPRYRRTVDLLHRAFGGEVYTSRKKDGDYPLWCLHLSPSKAKQFLAHFAKHSVVKKDQVDFVLGCAMGGNYRDGETIRDTMKHLKAREQRLSDPGADVNALLKTVDFDRPTRWKNRPAENRKRSA